MGPRTDPPGGSLPGPVGAPRAGYRGGAAGGDWREPGGAEVNLPDHRPCRGATTRSATPVRPESNRRNEGDATTDRPLPHPNGAPLACGLALAGALWAREQIRRGEIHRARRGHLDLITEGSSEPRSGGREDRASATGGRTSRDPSATPRHPARSMRDQPSKARSTLRVRACVHPRAPPLPSCSRAPPKASDRTRRPRSTRTPAARSIRVEAG